MVDSKRISDRTRRLLVGLVLAILTVASADAQLDYWEGPAAVAIEVRGDGGKPVEGAMVTFQVADRTPPQGPEPVTTDERGRVLVSNLAELEWYVEVRHDSFMLYAAYIKLKAGKKPVVGFSSQVNTSDSWTPMRIKFAKAKADFSKQQTKQERRAERQSGDVERAAEQPRPEARQPAPPVAPAPAPTEDAAVTTTEARTPAPSPPTTTTPTTAAPRQPAPQATEARQAPPAPEIEVAVEDQAADEAAERQATLEREAAEKEAMLEGEAAEVAAQEAASEALEAQRLETERLETERLEAERLEAERAAAATATVDRAKADPESETSESAAETVAEEPQGVQDETAERPSEQELAEAASQREAAEIEAAELAAAELAAAERAAEEQLEADRIEAERAAAEQVAAEQAAAAQAAAAQAAADQAAAAQAEIDRATEEAAEAVSDPKEAATPTAEPEPEPAQQPAPAKTTPPPAAVPTPSAPSGPRPIPSYMASADMGTCPSCQPGEWSMYDQETVASARDIAKVDCPGDLDAITEGLRLLVEKVDPTFAGPISAAITPSRYAPVGRDDRAEIRQKLGDYLQATSTCRLVGVLLPPGSSFAGYQYEAWGAAGGGACVAGVDCPVGRARWDAEPTFLEGPVTAIYTLFHNRSTRHDRRARFTVYFVPPGPDWAP